MGGGSEFVAQTTNYVFYVRYSSSCGINYTAFGIRKLKRELNQWNFRDAEWDIELSPWSMSEDDNNKFYEAFKELEKEHGAIDAFNKLTQEQKTLADIWHALKEAEHSVWVYKSRMEDAEKVLNDLRNIWYELEERKNKEAKKSEEASDD